MKYQNKYRNQNPNYSIPFDGFSAKKFPLQSSESFLIDGDDDWFDLDLIVIDCCLLLRRFDLNCL